MRRLIAALTFAAAPAAAQEASPAKLSLIAGYKATFTCSATFLADRTIDEIVRDELAGAFADYKETLAALPEAAIDREEGSVSVAYADGVPPRIAVYRGRALGCAQLPSGAETGWNADGFAEVGALKLQDDRPWPAGDALSGPVFADTPQGFNLAGVVRDAFDRKTYGEGSETTAVLVVADGAIVAERYREDFDLHTPQRTWSVAKSIAATVVGAAAHKGLVAVEDQAGLAQWSAPGDPRAAISVDDLLRMASGLDSGAAGNRTDDVYFGGGRIIDHAASGRLVAEPGARWVYANNDTMLAVRALRERMDDDKAFARFAHRTVLGPLGMTRTSLETDWNDDFVLSSQVWTTARDLARLGLLYLNDGVWNGARILPEGWTDYVATPGPAQPPATNPDGSARPGYGAQFWLFGERHGLPAGTYAAMGARGQFLVIVPARNILIVRRGFDDLAGGGGFDIAALARDVLAAIP